MVLVLVIVVILSTPIPRFLLPRHLVSLSYSWPQVRTAMDRQDFPEALSMAQTLVAREPNYYYGHAFLGAVYLAMNDITNSEVHYLRAYELFPDEESEKNLAAVRNRIKGPHDFKLISK